MTITTDNIQPIQPNKPSRSMPINKWTIGGAIFLAFILIALGSASAGGTPEPEVRTVTKTVVEEVEVEKDNPALAAKVDQCQDAVNDMAGLVFDLLGVITDISNGAATNNVRLVEGAVDEMNRLNDGVVQSVGAKAGTCNPNIDTRGY